MSASLPATAVIAEDEPALADALRRMLAQAWPELDVLRVAHDGDAALAAIRALNPDVAFLDVRMPGPSGLEVAAALAGLGNPPALVFVTAYDQYALQAFEAAAADYLLKPVSLDRLERCVARLRTALAQRTPASSTEQLRRLLMLLQQQLPAGGAGQGWLRFLRASVGDVIRQIPVEEILYLQAQDKYVSVVTRDATALVRIPLSELAALLDPARFAQVHRSTIVSLEAIDTIRRDFAGRTFVHLRPAAVGGREVRLAVSRQYAGQFRAM